MARVKKCGVNKKHQKILKETKGYYGARSRTFKVANQAHIKALQYAYRDRRAKKRTFRALWIVRINAAARELGMKYSHLIHKLSQMDICIDRKIDTTNC